MNEDITPPILVMTKELRQYIFFVKNAGFLPGETKRITSMDKIRAYKDKVLMVLSLPDDVDTYKLYHYTRAHNIRVVRI